ncbi:hypothetical protein C8T65DRAFT_686433 [Cerioporus squamosus]|nr:hypothetical protein C8T65DRAFT_686433 [Cerioporus squamosus]
MAPRTKKAADAIDKRRSRRQHIILQTLPPVVFSTPTHTVTIRFAMSAINLKQGRPESLDYASSSVPSVRQSFQSSLASEPTGVGKTSPSPSHKPASHKTFGSGGDRTSQHSGYVQAEYADVEDVEENAQRLEIRLQQEGTSIRQEMKQQVDRLDAKIDHVLENVLPKQFISVDARIDDLDKLMNKNFERAENNFQAVGRRFDRLEMDVNGVKDEIKEVKEEMKAMREDIHSIMLMLQMQQGASTHGHARSRYTSDASQLSAAGPSSPRRHQGPSVDAGDDEISLSSSKRETSQLFRTIRRMASRGSEILSKKKKGKGGVQ